MKKLLLFLFLSSRIFGASPTFDTVTATTGFVGKLNGLTVSTSTGTLTISNAKVFTVSGTLTLAGTDGSTLNIGTGGTLGTAAFTAATAYQAADADLTTYASITPSANVQTLLGAANFAAFRSSLGLDTGNSPTFSGLTATGVLTLGSGPTTVSDSAGKVLSSALNTVAVSNGGTGLTSGTSGGVLAYTASGTLSSSGALAANAIVIGGGAGSAPSTTTTGTGILTFLGTPSSANLASAITDETGSGSLVFGTSPTLTTAVLGSSTATTQSAGDNSTKVATTAYSDNTALSTILGTFASPNTAAGAVTWNTSSIAITTSASAATRTYTLPTASSYTGKRFLLSVGAGTNHVNVQPASGAALVLSGVLLTADHYVQAATSAVGNAVIGFSDGTNWQIFVCAGTWADSASP